MISFLQDLGPFWSWIAVVIVLVSAIMRTYLAIAFASGIVITLYLHPASTDGPTNRSRAFQRTREELDSFSLNSSMSDDVFKSMNDSIRLELEYLLDHTVNDYIRWWYQPPVFPEENRFPLACKHSLKYAIGHLYSSFSQKDPVFYFDAIFTNCVATLGVVLTDLKAANKLKGKDDPLGLQTFSRINPESPLARLLNSNESHANSKCCAQSILRYCAKPEDINCEVVSVLMTQILATIVIDKTLSSTAHKDFLNKVIVDYYNQAYNARNTVTQQRLAEQFESVTQEVVHTVAATEIFEAPRNNTIDRDSEAAICGQTTDTIIPVDDSAPKRGRRLSFKHRSMGSLGEISGSPSSDIGDAGKKHSFLKRTSSLLSRSSRSRSCSPIKSGPDRENGSIKSGETTLPLVNAANTFFQATILAYDASEIPTTMNLKDPITPAILPKFTIMISPRNPENLSGSHGICIIRTILDLEDLDTSLRRQRPGQVLSLTPLASWRDSTYSSLETQVNKYLTFITGVEGLAEHSAFRKFCSADFVPIGRTDQKPSNNLNISSVSSMGSSLSDGSKTLFGSLKKGVMFSSKSLNENSHFQEGPLERSAFTRQQAEPHRKANLEVENPSYERHEESSSDFPRARATSPTRNKDIGSKTSESSGAHIDTDAGCPHKTRSALDFQSLISQSMELLTAVFSLSARTWTIRKQLLNLLRNLLLSKNSAYASTIQLWLQETLFDPLSDPKQVAHRLHQFNTFMFHPEPNDSHKLSSEESRLLAKEARNLILQRSMPSAIKNLMGVECVHEALGIVFDAMQEQEFSEGLLSILLTESLRLLLTD